MQFVPDLLKYHHGHKSKMKVVVLKVSFPNGGPQSISFRRAKLYVEEL